MANQQHSSLGNQAAKMHGIVWQTVANAAGLAALVIVADDVAQARVVYQTDTGQRWVPKTVGAGATFELVTQFAVGLRETGGPTNLTIGALGNPSLLTRVGTAIVAATFSAGLSLAAGVVTLSPVSNTAQGAAPAITAATAALVSDGGGTTSSWVALSGGGSPLGTGRTISTTAPLAGGGDLSANRTLTVASVTNATSGVVPQTNGTLGQMLTSAAGAGAPTWGVDFGAQSPTTSGSMTLTGATSSITMAGATPFVSLGPSASNALGLVRVAYGTTIIGTRNSANAGDLEILSYGVAAASTIRLGNITSGSYRIQSSGAQDAYIGAVRQYDLGSQLINFRPDNEDAFLFQSAGTTQIALFASSTASTRNVSFFESVGLAIFNSGDRILSLKDATTTPTAGSAGRCFIYSVAGAMGWVDSSGNTVLFGSTAGTVIVVRSAAGKAGNLQESGSAVKLSWNSTGLGLYTAAPVAQAARVGQATNSTGVAAVNRTMSDVTNAGLADPAKVNLNFANIVDNMWNPLEAALHLLGATA